MKRFGAGNERDLTKEITKIKKYEETEVNHLSGIVCLMVDLDTTPKEGVTF